MSVCAACGRALTDQPPRYSSGSDRFCSYLCIDVYAARHVAADSNCGVPNCHVCSGAMRERAGKGDDT